MCGKKGYYLLNKAYYRVSGGSITMMLHSNCWFRWPNRQKIHQRGSCKDLQVKERSIRKSRRVHTKKSNRQWRKEEEVLSDDSIITTFSAIFFQYK